MKKQLPLLLSILVLSCSKNEESTVTVTNSFTETLYFQFRGETDTIETGESKTISDVPLGNYEYQSVVNIPTAVNSFICPVSSDTIHVSVPLKFEKGEGENNLQGFLSFAQSGTDYTILYGGSINIVDLKYTLFASVTSDISTPASEITK